MSAEQYLLVIEAGKTERQYWKDLWLYRELLGFLCWRDIMVRYKQTVIGVLWAVLKPLLAMLAFTIVFGRIANLPSEGAAPYAIMVYAAMLPWQFFSASLAGSSNSLVSNANLVSKVYFPRLLVPMSSVSVHIVDFCISFVLLLALMAIYQFMPPLQIVAVIPLAALTGLVALGPGLLFCALNVTYRDFCHIIPFITQFGLYISPVGFSSSIVPEKWRLLYEFNPMVGIIEAYRWAILGSMDFPARSFGIACSIALVFLVIGVKVFRSAEKTFADVI
ncbi:transport permease protein [Deltaproteobacteria bacterium]|nr:transport permease protein [Deltaproteobacteria bacterium]